MLALSCGDGEAEPASKPTREPRLTGASLWDALQDRRPAPGLTLLDLQRKRPHEPEHRTARAQLHQAFIAAAEGADGWVRYEWRDSLDEDAYTKIALVVKVQFNTESYYVGAGFNFAMESAIPDESEKFRSS